MQHRIALAVIISVIIMVGYNYLFPPPEPTLDEAGETAGGEDAGGETGGEEDKPEVEKIAAEDKDPGKDPGKDPSADPSKDPTADPTPEPAAPVSDIPLDSHRIQNELLAIDVDNQPGGLITGVEPLAEQFRDFESGVGIDFLLLAESRSLELGFIANETDFAWSRVPGQVRSKDAHHIEVSRRQGDVELIETLTILTNYEVQYEVVVRNHGEGQQRHRLELATRMGMAAEQSRYDIHRALCRTAEDVEDFDFDDVEEENESVKGGVDWIALDSKYFVQTVVPHERMSGCVVSSNETGDAIINTIVGREVTLGPGEQKRYQFGLFIGAKVDSMLAAFPESEPLASLPKPDLTETIDWGWFGRLSKLIGGMMLDLLRWFYGLFGIWGVAIIMLTVCIKAVLLPLTIKQYRSMRKMKELSPEMEKVREKYGDDKVKQQQEMQALFQRTGVNPLAGCMPMVLQFPVWIALYAMLGAVVDLYHEPFLWLPDLTQPDPYYILPIGMGALMFIQTRMNPTAGDAQQAKMMQWMMPGIFVVMMLFLPSGLGVYIFANIVLSLIQSFIQLRTGKSDEGKDTKDSKGDGKKEGAKGEGKSKSK